MLIMGINTVMFRLGNVAFATVAVQMQNYITIIIFSTSPTRNETKFTSDRCTEIKDSLRCLCNTVHRHR